MPSAGRLRYLEALPQGAGDRSSARTRRTLILLHAFPINAYMWEPQLALAEAGWHVIAPHLRGLGSGASADEAAETVPAGPVMSMDDYVGDVIDLLDALHVREAVIGGLSMGGYVALGMFRHAPRYFRGMVLADTRAPADTPEAKEGRTRTLALLREEGSGAVLDDLMPKLLGATTRRDRPQVAERVRQLVSLNAEAAIAGAITALVTRQDATPLLSSIHCPTLIIVGEEDTLTPPQMSEALHAAIAGSELVVVPGAGHLSSLERPRAFNTALEAFLTHRV
ncbi:MAG: alpha/beta fold hydrolase [Acidobacteria bacterium]|nr:alpha/beta fold hydrolase [Acidobacteriota bacterium]